MVFDGGVKQLTRLLLVSLMLGNSMSRGDILGDFTHVRNLPGYLDLSGDSQVSKNFISTKEYPDGVDRRTPSEILRSFLTDSGRFNHLSGNAFISKVRKFQQNAFLTYCSTKLPEDVSGNHLFCHQIDWENSQEEILKKLIKKWKKKEGYLAPQMAVDEMQRAMNMASDTDFQQINSETAQNFVEAFFNAIETFEYIRAEDPVWGRATAQAKYYALIAKSYLKSYCVDHDRPEAANVPVPENMKSDYPGQMFFSPEQVRKLEEEGFDTSVIDPVDSGFWRKPGWAMKDFDPVTFHRLGVKSLKFRHTGEQVEDILDPDKEISMEFTPSSPSPGQTPKIKAIFGDDQKWKVKFLTDKMGGPSPLNPANAVERLLISSEVNIEPAVNNLAAMLGFSVDPTYYKKKIRLYMPAKVYEEGNFDRYLEEEVLHVLTRRFKASWNIRSAFEKIKTDEKGRKYVEMQGVSLEKKSDVKTDRNMSLFIREGLGKSFKREYRAFSLFLALIQDPDIKDDNAKVKMVPFEGGDEKKRFKLVFSPSDMGVALGFGFPNIYDKDLVKNVRIDKNGRLKKIDLNYKTFFPLPAMETISFSDARWLMRKVARISPEKLRDVFRAAGYPVLVAEYYRDIFLRRSEQLYSALGMLGWKIKGHDGDVREIGMQSRIGDPDRYAVPGYEHMFKEGKLNDPDQTLFDPTREFYPRDWGTDTGHETSGRHKDEFYKILTKGLLLQGGNLVQKTMLQSFQFSNVMFDGNSGSPLCRNRCFYAGYKFGLDWFIPMRFVIENPTSGAKDRPYWVVDMFRLAVTLGAGSDTAFGQLGLPVGPDVAGLGGEFVMGKDFIKIRPVRDYTEATEMLQNEGATRKFLFRNLSEQIIDHMEPGDLLIGSSYVGSRASVMVQGRVNFLFNAGLETGIESYLTNRIYLMKGTGNILLANWADLKRINVFAAAFMQALFIRSPILKADYKASSERNRVFRFDLNNPAAREQLFANINRANPDKVSAGYRNTSKFVKERAVSIAFNVFGLYRNSYEKGRTEVLGKNFVTGDKVHEITYERERKLRLLSHLDIIDRSSWEVKAQLNEQGQVFAKISAWYFLNQSYAEDFENLVHRNRAFMPGDFLIFDLKSSKYYQGDLNFKSVWILGPGGIHELFGPEGPTDQKICESYAKIQRPKKDPRLWCSGVFEKKKLSHEKRHAIKLLKRFSEARILYRALWPRLNHAVDNGNLLDHVEFKNEAYRLLKQIVRVLFKNRKEHKVVDALLPFISRENFYRDAQLTSFMEGFPGLTDKIETSRESAGDLSLLRRYLVTETDDVFYLFTDEIDDALKSQGLLDRTTVRYGL